MENEATQTLNIKEMIFKQEAANRLAAYLALRLNTRPYGVDDAPLLSRATPARAGKN